MSSRWAAPADSPLVEDGWLARRFGVLRAVGRDVAIVGPVLAVFYLTLFALAHVPAYDFEKSFYPAAQHFVSGQSPFPPATHASVKTGTAFVYPPLTAMLIAPLTLLPVSVAGVLFTLLLAGATVLTLRTLGVRDWRCYTAVFLWPPVLSGLQTANLTLLLALGVALLWRYRDRQAIVVATAGLLIALKLFLWPLVIWLFATRRVAGGIKAIAAAALVTVGSWAVIGFAGIHEYVPLIRVFSDDSERRGYTPLTVLLRLGFGFDVSRALWLAFGAGLVCLLAVLARRGLEREAFVLAIAASILCSPTAWLHYYSLLIVAVAMLRPRYDPLWLLPFVVIAAPAAASGPSWWSLTLMVTFAVVVMGSARGLEWRHPQEAHPRGATSR